jgi:serine protease inhibitor
MLKIGFAPILLLCSAVACGDVVTPALAPSSPAMPAPAAIAQLPRPLGAAETTVRDASNAFSFALWQQVNATEPDTNVFLSPLSASFALGMTMNGAANTTYTQMLSALQFGNASLASIDSGYQSLIALLESLDPAVQMQIANAVWYRTGFPFLQSFLDTTRVYFGATVQGLNFADVTGSLATINGWVSGATGGKIPTVLDTIDPNEVMFLLNAIYFKGSWRSRFDPTQTAAATFTGNGNTAEPMQLMHQVQTLPYMETGTFQAVDLPYGDSAFSMTVLLPKNTTDIEALAKSLTPGVWQSIIGGFSVQSLSLSLPKLTLSYGLTLNADLNALGMIDAFSPTGADFTRMAPAPYGTQLSIDFVKQSSSIDIDEDGTVATAATAVGVGLVSVDPAGPPVMRVDHPYLIAIRERLTGTLLFMGKIVHIP